MKSTASRARHFGGKTVILTGAASGIGLSLVRLLTRAGATVHAIDVNSEGLAMITPEAGAPGTLHTHVADVADRQAFESTLLKIASAGRSIDFLFNNAGVTLLGEAQNLPFDRWKRLLDINLMGVIHGTGVIYPIMIRQGSGHIVNTASIAGATGYATAAAYTASKAAVLEVTRSLRSEAEIYGVKITVVCPGYVDSGIFAQDRIVGADRKTIIDDLPVKMMTPDQAAEGYLKGVISGRHTTVFPTSARFLWALAHWAPSMTHPFQKRFLRTFSKEQ